MTPTAFKRKLKQHDLTPEQAADLMGATRRTGYYWVEQGPPHTVALIFELMDRLSLTYKYIHKVGREINR